MSLTPRELKSARTINGIRDVMAGVEDGSISENWLSRETLIELLDSPEVNEGPAPDVEARRAFLRACLEYLNAFN